MMKWIAAVPGVVMVAAGLTVSAQTDVTGTWNTAVELDFGAGDVVFVFNQDGETLTGTYAGAFGTAEITGTVMGDMIEFTFEAEGAGEATYTGKIMGDTMEGTCDYADTGGGTWTAEKSG